MTMTTPDNPPTTEEVVDVLAHTRKHFMRKPHRDVIRNLLRHRDALQDLVSSAEVFEKSTRGLYEENARLREEVSALRIRIERMNHA